MIKIEFSSFLQKMYTNKKNELQISSLCNNILDIYAITKIIGFNLITEYLGIFEVPTAAFFVGSQLIINFTKSSRA